MALEIRKLRMDDGRDVYDMLQEIPADENGVINSAHGIPFEQYGAWLEKSAASAEQQGIVDGWKVPQTTFWLLEDGRPVGFGKVRHFLTDALRQEGGNVGYSLRPSARGRGLGTKFVAMLLEESRKLGLEQALITVQETNIPSMKAAVANGGKIVKTANGRYYIEVDL